MKTTMKTAFLALLLIGCGVPESAPPIPAPVADMARADAKPPQLVLAFPRSIPTGAETEVHFVGIGDGIALDKLQRSHFNFGLCDYDILSFTYTPRGPNAFTLSLNVRPGVAPATCDLTITPQGLTLLQALSLVAP